MTEKLTIAEAAAALGVTRNTVLNMGERGQLRVIKNPYGRPRMFVPAQDVQALLDQIAEASAPAKPASEITRKRKGK